MSFITSSKPDSAPTEGSGSIHSQLSASRILPRYSVVVVAYNCLENLRPCIDALRLAFASQPGGSACGEIVVVDNASRDGTGAWLTAQPDLITMLNPDNRGFSQACNQGAVRSQGEFVLFLNPDTLITKEALPRMSAHLMPGIGAVGPLSNYVAALQRLDVHWPGEAPAFSALSGHDALSRSEAIAAQLAHYRAGQGVESRLLIGFCLMMRKALFEDMNGMDNELFLGNDDLDLSWRLQLRGLKLVVATDAFVFHEGQKSFNTEPRPHVDALVQQSTDALWRKLVRHYGSAEAVPSSISLWGIDWFKPSQAALHYPIQSMQTGTLPAQEAVMSASSLFESLSIIIAIPHGPQAETAARKSLRSLPQETADICMLDLSGDTMQLESPKTARRLDFGNSMPAGFGWQAALRTAKQDLILLLPAGFALTALAAHWLSRRAVSQLPDCMTLPVSGSSTQLPPALLVKRTVLLKAIGHAESNWSEILMGLKSLSEQYAKNQDAPWLDQDLVTISLWKAVSGISDTAPALTQSNRPVVDRDTRIACYPESLRNFLRAAKQNVFLGKAVGPIEFQGEIRGVDMAGATTDLKDRDLVILRVTPDMLPQLTDCLKTIRARANRLEKLVVIFNQAQSIGAKGDARNFVTPVDLTLEGMGAALQLAGFKVLGDCNYVGFEDPAISNGPLKGWHQIEAMPRKETYSLARKVSIIILGFNQVEYTRKCVESIQKQVQQNHELILVDNGSSDGTAVYFASVAGAKVIRNERNLGVAAGWNCGLRVATGEYICILNNDTILGKHSLENMIRLLESDSQLGLVGPRSNCVAGPQEVPGVEGVAYRTENDIPTFIQKWSAEHNLESAATDWVKGVCMVMQRSVFEQVGFFDERFGKGNFEDDDYSLRVRLNGYRAAIAHDSFLHHFGSRSFGQEGVDWKAQMQRNRAEFDKKWARGKEALHDEVVATRNEKNHLSAEAKNPMTNTSSGWTAVAPTETANQATHIGVDAKLAAANQAYEAGDLNKARGLWLEVENMQPQNPDALTGLGIIAFHQNDTREAAVLLIQSLRQRPLDSDTAQNLVECLIALNGTVSEVEMNAFIQRFPGNPVFHEVLKMIRSENLQTMAKANASSRVENDNWRDEVEALIEAGQHTKALDWVSERMRGGKDTGICFNYMGVIAHTLGNASEAQGYFSQAIQIGPVETDFIRNAIDTLLELGRFQEAKSLLETATKGAYAAAPAEKFLLALETLSQIAAEGAPDSLWALASLHANEAAEQILLSSKAAEAQKILLELVKQYPRDFRAYNNLGLCAFHEGDHEGGWKSFLKCLEIHPACGDALVNAFDCSLQLKRTGEMKPLLEKALRLAPHLPEGQRIQRHIEREGDALIYCHSYVELEDETKLIEEAEARMRSGASSEAKSYYEDVLARRAENPQALNGLGILAFARKDWEEAFNKFEAAARFNSSDQDILLNLWEAARAFRHEEEAMSLLKRSLDNHPGLQEVRAIVSQMA